MTTLKRHDVLIHILLLHRESNAAVAPIDPRVDVTRRIKGCIAKGGMLGLGLFAEYADALGINPEADVASKLMQIWNKVGVFWLLLAAIPFHQPQTSEWSGSMSSVWCAQSSTWGDRSKLLCCEFSYVSEMRFAQTSTPCSRPFVFCGFNACVV